MGAGDRVVNAVRVLPEERSAELATPELAFGAARAALLAAAGGDATTFPVVVGHAHERANRFTVKSASTPEVAGVKVGTYWPGNADVPRHNSTILLLDNGTGRLAAVVEAGAANALRTAAADAVAVDALSREDSRTMAIFGAGHQALHECVAVARVRRLERIVVVARSGGEEFVRALRARGLPAEPGGPEEACASDVVVTATTARAPLFDARWLRPGAHVSSMGSDARGKQELPPWLLATATLFCDLPEQSREIGEFQHAPADARVTALGHVLSGAAPGRRSPEEITAFDSSGLAVQDLHLALALLAADRGSG
ncbi:ornithine cyclodeaminase family protein [Actinosynnema pretiosum subsp. pretiosum]|uniref:Ornithine cyclodeaminase family protein n=1 Tax=Actinosynnema pretiosum subsp. pretiosum TaxID=103721 RepID=A0AA45L9L9_9PSEU|nr:ornithine cyclodeaminase family protein [Actinosynnema pretiosum subsp. pretiosum]